LYYCSSRILFLKSSFVISTKIAFISFHEILLASFSWFQWG
jgi:hypothetical protein